MAPEPRIEWRSTERAIVLDTRGDPPRVLLVPSQDGRTWTLPSWTAVEPRERDPDVGRIAVQARDVLGFDVVLLQYVEPTEDEAARERSGTWIMEPRGVERPAATSAGARWVTAADLDMLPAANGDALRLARQRLAELTSDQSPLGRCAWCAPRWLAEAEAWIARQLDAIGRPATGPTVQFRSNSISSVLRAPTARGDVYFKAASHHFRTEARITTGLATRFGEHLPTLLAVNVERSWLLMEDFGPRLRESGQEVWETALRLMGELQRRCIGETDWLLSIGAADRRLAILREQIPALLDAPETRREVAPELHARLVARIPRFQEACDALAACGVPETLIHGDLHGGNVAATRGRVTLFDWTDAAVAHPFLDLVTFLPSERRTPVAAEGRPLEFAQRLRDAYLEGWTAYATPGQLRRALTLLNTVQQLHHAQSYLQILRSLEPADYWQWEGELAQWLTPLAKNRVPGEPAYTA
ncbi:MAG TPA: aminoglycoside phosphotransferase family protein [Chloroflexota bacterium]|nr:aminoglycoside phosphotransferase family protein [Chloroflexota bacterium]